MPFDAVLMFWGYTAAGLTALLALVWAATAPIDPYSREEIERIPKRDRLFKWVIGFAVTAFVLWTIFFIERSA